MAEIFTALSSISEEVLCSWGLHSDFVTNLLVLPHLFLKGLGLSLPLLNLLLDLSQGLTIVLHDILELTSVLHVLLVLLIEAGLLEVPLPDIVALLVVQVLAVLLDFSISQDASSNGSLGEHLRVSVVHIHEVSLQLDGLGL